MRTRRKPVQERAVERVERLLAATAELLGEDGYEGVTTNHIAQRAGVPVGSVYQYFPNKDALVAELIDRHVERMVALLDRLLIELAEAPLREAASAYVRAVIAAHQAEPALLRVLYAQTPRLDGRVRNMSQELRGRIEGYLADHAAELRPQDHELSAFLLVHGVEAIAQAAVRERPELLSEDQLATEIIQLVLGYLGVSKEST